MNISGIQIPDEPFNDICRKHGLRRVSLFGSALGSRFSDASDIDLLVEFEPGRTPGLIAFAGIALEFEQLLGRTVDLRTPADLSKYFRDAVMAEARVLHAA